MVVKKTAYLLSFKPKVPLERKTQKIFRKRLINVSIYRKSWDNVPLVFD